MIVSKRARKSRVRALEAALRAHALGLPQATEDFPWGERAIKVRGKAFLFMRATASELSFSVKLPKSSFQALMLPFVKPTGYGLGRHGWVTVTVVTDTRALRDQLLTWIDESYRSVSNRGSSVKGRGSRVEGRGSRE